MFGALGAIFGSPKTMGKIVNSAIKGIDALKYTAEEKAHDAAEERKAAAERKMKYELQRAEIAYRAQEQIVSYMEATQGQNMARRFLAIGMFLTWLAIEATSVTLGVASAFVDNPTAVLQAAGVVGEAIEGVDQYLLLILAFYFGAPHLSSLLDTLADRRLSRKSGANGGG